MPVITLTGRIASGAREIGPILASSLNIDYVDQQLMVQAANRCGVPVGVVAERDERRATFRQRLGAAINTMLERSAASGGDPLEGPGGLEAVLSRTYADVAQEEENKDISDETYIETMSALIRELAATGRIVILGRGSQMVLRDLPGALHVLTVAPQELRVQRLAEREEIGMEDAARRAKESDRAREAFYKKFWKVDVQDPRLYDLTIDTSRFTYEQAAEVIAEAIRIKAISQ
ncbi:MAG TPA: cytidylate kinase-like family protein [Dehalococcoidia bacterium]|nr:cytidylate kinase-like family protein [Dehalococcoidia bacterium]